MCGQTVKHQKRWSKFLTLVTAVTTAPIGVTTPCDLCWEMKSPACKTTGLSFLLYSAERVWLVRLQTSLVEPAHVRVWLRETNVWPPPLPGNEWLHWGHPPCGAKRHMDLMCTSRISVQVVGRKTWWLYPVTEEAVGDWTEVRA